MTTRQLPERPDLEQLKRQAKDLLRSARAAVPAALSRFRALPAFAGAGDEVLTRTPLALHDAQSVIAREHGFPSWNALRERVEELTLELDQAVVEFVEAATNGRGDRAERILALHPGMATASFHAALVLGDARAVAGWLDERPALARGSGGARGWEPIHYVCHTALARGWADREAGVVAIARRLLELGVDPDTRFPWRHHDVHRPVLWGALFETRVLDLARVLLEAGARADDGVTLTLAAGGGDLDALELLAEHGADPDQRWATDGSAALYAALQWADTPVGIRWLVEHGADPDTVFGANGEAPLHVVARRWDADMARLLVEHGADPRRGRSDGRTPYQVAELNGNRDVADWLLRSGAGGEIAGVDRLVAAGSRGDRATVAAMLAERPGLRDAISDEHHGALHRAAERGDAQAIEALLACGLDPDHVDDGIGKTALHGAAMEGWIDAVRVLLAHGASVDKRDREFHGQPLVWAAEGARMRRGARAPGRDYDAVARLLLDAGSPVTWGVGEEPSEGLREILEAWGRR